MSDRYPTASDRKPKGEAVDTMIVDSPSTLASPATRRRFLQVLGMGGSIVFLPTVFAACSDDDNPMNPPPPPPPGPEAVTIDLSNDTGVLNYAYALEQLEAAFYVQVATSFFAGATADEQAVLTDLRDHEVAHREFYKAALGSAAIPALTPNFSTVNFSDRMSVLQTARTFEDLGVAAYNGVGARLTDPALLTVAGKIVSVEARHASVIRTLLGLNFAPEAFDEGMNPTDVATAAGAFIDNDITLQNA